MTLQIYRISLDYVISKNCFSSTSYEWLDGRFKTHESRIYKSVLYIRDYKNILLTLWKYQFFIIFISLVGPVAIVRPTMYWNFVFLARPTMTPPLSPAHLRPVNGNAMLRFANDKKTIFYERRNWDPFVYQRDRKRCRRSISSGAAVAWASSC